MHKVFKSEQRPPMSPESAPEQALVALERTTDHLRREIHLLLRTFGLTSTQYNALRSLEDGAQGGLTCSALASQLISADPDITRLLDRLARQGLVRRRRDARDRRVVLTEMTEAGSALLRSIRPQLEARVRQLFAQVPQPRMEALLDLLDEVRRSAREEERESKVEQLPENRPLPATRAG